MPMSPRLLRPIASSLDPDAAVYLNAVAVADGQQLEPAIRKAINDFVIGCKRDGIWDAIKASCILAGARTLAGALVPLKGAAPTNNNFVSGDYNRETGLVGNGSTKYLDSNRAQNADGQDDFHQAIFASTLGTNAYLGAGAGVAGSGQISKGSGSAVAFYNRSSTVQDVVPALSPTPGLVAHSRSGSASFSTRLTGATDTHAIASQSPLSVTSLVFARNSSVGVAGFFGTSRLAFYSIGESLDLAALDNRVSALITAIGAAI